MLATVTQVAKRALRQLKECRRKGFFSFLFCFFKTIVVLTVSMVAVIVWSYMFYVLCLFSNPKIASETLEVWFSNFKTPKIT